MNIGEKIKTLRNSLNLNQQEFADKINVHFTTISKIENGTRQPSISLIYKISETFNTNINYLLEQNMLLDNKDISDLPIVIGINIKRYREKLELSQEEFAYKIGISRNALINYENGKRTPSIEVLYKISIACNITLSYLLGYLDNTFSIKNFSDNELLEEIQRRLNKRN